MDIIKIPTDIITLDQLLIYIDKQEWYVDEERVFQYFYDEDVDVQRKKGKELYLHLNTYKNTPGYEVIDWSLKY